MAVAKEAVMKPYSMGLRVRVLADYDAADARVDRIEQLVDEPRALATK